MYENDNRPLTPEVVKEILGKCESMGYFKNFERLVSPSKSQLESLHQDWKLHKFRNNARDINSMLLSYYSFFGSLKGGGSCVRAYFKACNEVVDEPTIKRVLSNLKKVL